MASLDIVACTFRTENAGGEMVEATEMADSSYYELHSQESMGETVGKEIKIRSNGHCRHFISTFPSRTTSFGPNKIIYHFKRCDNKNRVSLTQTQCLKKCALVNG